MATGHFKRFAASDWTSRLVGARRGAIRRAALVAAVAAAPLLVSVPAHAQAVDVVPEVENAPHSFEGQVNQTTYVRSGPSDTFYPTQKVTKGTTVIVVAMKGSWLKIQPPEGSFSYVQKAYVNKYGDGKTGKVTQALVVHAGSQVQPQMQSAVQTKLDAGQDVTILGEENEYFKIKPPESAYVFIRKDDVTPIRPVSKTRDRVADPAGMADQTPPPAPPRPMPPVTSHHSQSEYVAAPETRPSTVAAVPTTGPSTSESLAKLQKLEEDFTAASKLPLSEQPLDTLLAGYEELASSQSLPEPTRKVADARASTIKARVQAKDQFLTYQKRQEEQQQKMQAQAAERQELEAHIRQVDVTIYSAVGTLRQSSLQVGNGPAASRTMLYRLTDPATGRTVAYVRTADPRCDQLIGQFIGVKGAIGSDPQLNLKVIAPTVIETVDPAKVNGNVAAEILPPSMEAKASASATGTP